MASTLLRAPGVSPVEWCRTDASGTLLAIGMESKVIVLNALKGVLFAVLDGHGSPIRDCAFGIHRPETLLTAGEDRTFKVWDLAARVLLFQSAIVSSSPFLALAMDPVFPRVHPALPYLLSRDLVCLRICCMCIRIDICTDGHRKWGWNFAFLRCNASQLPPVTHDRPEPSPEAKRSDRWFRRQKGLSLGCSAGLRLHCQTERFGNIQQETLGAR